MSEKTLKVTYVRSALGYAQDQQTTLRSLGFTRLHQTKEIADTPSLRGMVYKIRHLVSVEGEEVFLGTSPSTASNE